MKKLISELYPNIKDCYTINELGEIKNENTGNVIKHKIERNGYVRISLMKKDGGTTYISLHRALMMAFNLIEIWIYYKLIIKMVINKIII